MEIQYEWSYSNKLFVILMASLLVTILIDTSVVKVNDLIDRYFIPLENKLVLFSINSIVCLLLQFFVIRSTTYLFEEKRSRKPLKIKSFHLISIVSLGILGTSIGLLIFQQFYFGYYESWTSMVIIIISYGTGAAIILWLAKLFLSWYRSNRSLIVFLYFISMIVIAFNLVIAATYVTLKVSSRPAEVGEYIGGSGDTSGDKYSSVNITFSISSFAAFFSIWFTTAILLNYYREKAINRILYWVLLSIPIVYFVITFFYQVILSTLLISYLVVDPVTVSIFLSAFLSLSKPIGGLLFGAAFWSISRTVKYERRIRTFMIISGWGIFLIFASNQAATQIVGPYPSFGLATITVLNLAAYLVLVGIYNSAKLVSVNDALRKHIYQHALRSGLLHSIGEAEMEKEIQKTVGEIVKDQKNILERERVTTTEFDEAELRKYLDQVINEVKKERSS